MKWLTVLYETIWFRCHPMIGPVAVGDPMPAIYSTWREAWDLARSLVQ